MPTLKGTQVSLSCVQCFFYLESSSISSLFFIVHGWVPAGQTSCEGERGTGPPPRRMRHRSGQTKQ